MNVKSVIQNFSDFELYVMQDRIEYYLLDDEYRSLENLLTLIVEEINNRRY
ncbi:hypothetical protein [Aquibacillus kalidii]|uniref:hypothetical protein n=1 Tax=Aquibacillus kalidii TaxID=2762597 RepID=UPI001646FB0F|nr:hypothetical protein [Aquibacillus kalidii]